MVYLLQRWRNWVHVQKHVDQQSPWRPPTTTCLALRIHSVAVKCLTIQLRPYAHATWQNSLLNQSLWSNIYHMEPTWTWGLAICWGIVLLQTTQPHFPTSHHANCRDFLLWKWQLLGESFQLPCPLVIHLICMCNP